MHIKTISVGPIETNCYIVTDEKGIGIIIDPGFEAWKIEGNLNKTNQIKYIVLTHSHFDHFLAAKKLKEKTGASIVIHEVDAPNLENPNLSLLSLYDELDTQTIKADITVNENTILSAGDLTLNFLHTPGHTKGSMCILIDNVMFSGDTLFRLSIGRTDLPDGNMNEMLSSLKKLFALEKDYKVYPGHMVNTTLFYERENNPYNK